MVLKKHILRRVGAWLLLTLAAAPLVQAAPGPVDPIVGDWFWFEDHLTKFRADGTAVQGRDMQGTWEYLRNPEANRHYRVVWDHGKHVDTVVCTEDVQGAYVSGSQGHRYHVRRALPDGARVSAGSAGR